jgi:hypothetical protein
MKKKLKTPIATNPATPLLHDFLKASSVDACNFGASETILKALSFT